jgi:spermidine/putrescine transport system ATP-binding protein
MVSRPAVDTDSVVLESVTKRFGDVTAVNGIDLAIKEGEFFTMLGPSGCGKTTTLRMIAGFEELDAGRLTIDGDDMLGIPPHKRPTNTVFQSYALFPHLTVTENVAFGLKRKRVDKNETDRRVKAELERVGLATEGNRKPNQLSGGMQQRVSLSRALVCEPDLLLMDEPFGALDEFTREKLNLEIQRIWMRQHTTILFVTHNIAEAVFLSDQVLVMTPRPGRLARTIRVPFPRPRAIRLLKEPEFAALVFEIRDVLGVA